MFWFCVLLLGFVFWLRFSLGWGERLLSLVVCLFVLVVAVVVVVCGFACLCFGLFPGTRSTGVCVVGLYFSTRSTGLVCDWSTGWHAAHRSYR